MSIPDVMREPKLRGVTPALSHFWLWKSRGWHAFKRVIVYRILNGGKKTGRQACVCGGLTCLDGIFQPRPAVPEPMCDAACEEAQ